VRNEEAGLLAPPDDADGIAAALARLAADRALAQQLGARGRALVSEQHDQRRSAERMLDVLARSGS
jgi:glycosyltransferase involved in cell wall biosynthesis